MNKKAIEWWIGGASFSPVDLSPYIYWDNGSSYMASDGSSWTDRINGLNLASSGTGLSRATGINGKLKLVNTTSGYWTRAVIPALQNISAFTIWFVGKRITIYHGLNSTVRTQFNIFTDDIIYGAVANGTFPYGQFSTGANTDYYAVMVYDGSLTGNSNRVKIWTNGVQRSLTFTGTIPAATENNASSVTQIGRTLTTNVASDNYEIGVVTRAITSQEITNLNGFLASRYAL